MAMITLRAVKGSPLTIAEMDANFSSLKVGADRAEAGTALNTPSTLVARDASGNFSASVITVSTVSPTTNDNTVATTAFAILAAADAAVALAIALG